MPSNSFGNVTLTPTGGDMSQTQVYAGPIDVRLRRVTAIQAIYTGAPVGSLQLVGSLMAQPGTPPSVNWANLGAAVAVSAAGSYLWDVLDTGCIFLAVLYTKSSGTGTLSVIQSTKGS